MKPTSPIASMRLTRWGHAVIWVGACVAIMSILLAGCSPQRNYKVLSFFFDGVPDPNKPVGAAQDEMAEFGPRTPGAQVIAFEHKPYKDGKCDSCHAGADVNNFESFQKVGNAVCLKCHVEKLTQYPVMHGPVVAVECLLCHQPHESTIPGMLNAAAPQVCAQCHERDLLSAKPPEHKLADSKCLECHVAHGGPKHGLLRVDALPTKKSPTTNAATTAPARGVRS